MTNGELVEYLGEKWNICESFTDNNITILTEQGVRLILVRIEKVTIMCKEYSAISSMSIREVPVLLRDKQC